ncbi:hypothetical protein KCP78_10430 [Salmonella enterica subsp. enterica]|nr:hypothetical protein KCP78_10430 [Salmonella enterica subsp. enterica]
MARDCRAGGQCAACWGRLPEDARYGCAAGGSGRWRRGALCGLMRRRELNFKRFLANVRVGR